MTTLLLKQPARSARSTTPRARAQHAAGNLDNRHVGIVCAASAHVNVSVLYQFIDTAKRPWPTGVAPRRISFGRAARGSVAPRKMACRPAAGGRMRRFKAINSRTEEGAAWSLPLSNRERDMDAKTRDLALLAALSLFCAGVAWILDHLVFGSVFFALAVAAALGIAWEQ